MRSLWSPARACAVSGACIWMACAPQDIYLFDPVARADAGATVQPRPVTPVPPPPAGASRPVQPACDSSACETCVEQDRCRVGESPLLCHPRSGECHFWCDPGAVPSMAGACTGDQQCDAALGMCVACLTRAHCTTSERPACDVPSGECVECVVADDCPSARPACDPVMQRCERCIVDSDCAVLGQVCQTENNTCVVCRDDDDCAGREDSRCLPTELRCVECLSDSDCGSDPERPLCSTEFECDDD